jgi:hypothetical protein
MSRLFGAVLCTLLLGAGPLRAGEDNSRSLTIGVGESTGEVTPRYVYPLATDPVSINAWDAYADLRTGRLYVSATGTASFGPESRVAARRYHGQARADLFGVHGVRVDIGLTYSRSSLVWPLLRTDTLTTIVRYRNAGFSTSLGIGRGSYRGSFIRIGAVLDWWSAENDMRFEPFAGGSPSDVSIARNGYLWHRGAFFLARVRIWRIALEMNAEWLRSDQETFAEPRELIRASGTAEVRVWRFIGVRCGVAYVSDDRAVAGPNPSLGIGLALIP